MCGQNPDDMGDPNMNVDYVVVGAPGSQFLVGRRMVETNLSQDILATSVPT